MIEILKKSIIYVACPASVHTGGPELLHQLVYKLNKFGFNAKMFYYGEFEGSPVHEGYKMYNNDYVLEIEDKKENLLIVPEVKINIAKSYSNIKKSIWWLSVDNYFKPYENRYIRKLKKIFNIETNYINKNFYKIHSNIIKNSDFHFVQSKYAENFLINKKIPKDKIFFLSDYLKENFLNQKVEYSSQNRENNVLYNPKKGIEFTKKIMKYAPDINWIPIQGMTSEEVANLLKSSKVYIDFGNHPGKDRFPREAAIMGCCVITGKRGSAKNEEDVLINSEYKFDDNKENIPEIVKKIKELLKNYDSEIDNFSNYRDRIMKEEKMFEDDILKIFKKVN
jgi:hypothetical protein